MSKNNVKKFQEKILNSLSFSPEKLLNYTLYRNKQRPELGYYKLYERPNMFYFFIADYTIPKDFSLTFSHKETMLRFGNYYHGKTIFLEDSKEISFSQPTSFLVVEKCAEGTQKWPAGQHYHGIEITIFEEYFKTVLSKTDPNVLSLSDFPENHSFYFLPEEVIHIVEQITRLSETDQLTPTYLDAKVLECIAILTNSLSNDENAFSYQIDYGSIVIGKNRHIRLTPNDIRAAQQAHDILSKELLSPPTIPSLSQAVGLGEQKLKATFRHIYHMSIGEYTASVRMTKASNLLATTDLLVEEIAHLVGYEQSSNFARMFRKRYNLSPASFRKNTFIKIESEQMM